MNNIQHISFDLDGTLIDSLNIMETAWNSVRAQFGINTPFSEYRSLIGLPFPKIMELLHLSRIGDQIAGVYFGETAKHSRNIKFLPTAKNTLDTLRHRGHSVSIITSKPRASAQEVCSKLSIEVDMLICGDDQVVGKPHASVANPLLKQFKLPS